MIFRRQYLVVSCLVAVVSLCLGGCDKDIEPPMQIVKDDEEFALVFEDGEVLFRPFALRQAPIPDPATDLTEEELSTILLDETTEFDEPELGEEFDDGALAFGELYSDYDLWFQDLESPPYVFECRGPPVRPAPLRRPVRNPTRYPPSVAPKPWELDLAELCRRLRSEQERKTMEAQIRRLERFGQLDATFTDTVIDEWTRLYPRDKTYTSDQGCTVDHIARWQEGGTNPTHPWQRYQTNVTGQLGSYVVRSPSGQRVSFDGIRVMGPKILLGIEAKARTDPSKKVHKVADWIDQAKRQKRIAIECGFRLAWVIGVPRAYRTMQMHLFREGVEEVYFSRATAQGGGELYERLLARELRNIMGPGFTTPP